MESDRERWDDRYRDANAPLARPPEAVAGVEGMESLIPHSGIALDVACGTGAQTLWLARRGLSVIALDVSTVAIEVVRRAAQSLELSSRIDARVVDLDAGLPDDVADVDLVVCQRFRQPLLYDSLVRVLRPGGLGIVTVLSSVGLQGDGGPFHAPPGDLSKAFDGADVEILLDTEERGLASVVYRRR
jgi:SAM-dependent methyltransferase